MGQDIAQSRELDERRRIMERLKVTSEVNLCGIICKHENVMEFEDDENVFGRVLKYHKYMRETFPGREWRLVKADRIKEGE